MMRKAFSLITAIMFIVLVATLGALALSFSTQTAKQTSDLYLKTQAELLVRSGGEFALLAISGHEINATSGCLNQINATYPAGADALFDINITMQYLGRGLPVANPPICNILDNSVAHNDSNVTVLMDIVVASRDGIATEPIRLHRRTLQKP